MKQHLHMANDKLRETNVIWVFVTVSVQVNGANILLMHRWLMDTPYRWVTGCVYHQRPINVYLTHGMIRSFSNQTGTTYKSKITTFIHLHVTSYASCENASTGLGPRDRHYLHNMLKII